MVEVVGLVCNIVQEIYRAGEDAKDGEGNQSLVEIHRVKELSVKEKRAKDHQILDPVADAERTPQCY